MSFVLGIDLGTTYSCVSYVDQYDRPVILRNREGEFTTPSVVLIEKDGRRIVGSIAKRTIDLSPDRTVQFIKRKMGKEKDSVTIDGTVYRAPEISAMILKKVVLDANKYLKDNGVIRDTEEITDVVITCPAYFAANERNATREAGRIAGLNVLDIVNEPTAAAISYGLSGMGRNETILVYDLGGGTFDITVMDIAGRDFSVVCIGGDDQLGGKDWDEALINYIIGRYMEEYKIDLSEEPEIIASLYVEVEGWKRVLTERENVTISVVGPTGKRLREEITRAKFNEITIDLLNRTKNLLDDVLYVAEQKGYPISSIGKFLLVGGSSRMPQVADMIKRDYHISPLLSDPEEAVAKGAALFAKERKTYRDFLIGEAKKENRTVAEIMEKNLFTGDYDRKYLATVTSQGKTGLVLNVSNVLSRTYGISSYIGDDLTTMYISNILMKNDRLPAKVTKSYFTIYENQECMDIDVYETLSSEDYLDIDGRTPIADYVIEFFRPVPKETEVKVTFALDNSGLLHIIAVEQLYYSKLDVTFQLTKHMTDSEMKYAISRMNNSEIE